MPSQPRIAMIAAIAENLAIGKNNQLLWHLPKDFQFFKKHTKNKTIIMGKNTWLSLPQKPLPHRHNIIISRSLNIQENENITCHREIKHIPWNNHQENIIIGGASLYEYFLPYSNILYLTHVKTQPDADTFFPKINLTQWRHDYQELHPIDNQHQFEFSCNIYTRK